MQGPPYFWNPATEFTIRSAPTSCGCSINTGIPVLIPGRTTNGVISKYFDDISLIEGNKGGTTQLTAMPPSFTSFRPASDNRFLIRTPCSSDVRSRTVVKRQLFTSFPLRNRPTTV